MKGAGLGILGVGIALVVVGIVLGSYTESSFFGLVQSQPYAELGSLLASLGIIMIIVGTIIAIIGAITDEPTQPQVQIFQAPPTYYIQPQQQQPYYQSLPQQYSPQSPSDQSSLSVFCGNCGKPIGSQNKFCPSCGASR